VAEQESPPVPLDRLYEDFEIVNLDGMARYFEMEPGSTYDQIYRALYEYTESGAYIFELTEREYAEIGPGIKLGAVIESDGEATVTTREHVLHYPFNRSDVDSAVSQIEEEATELWHIENCHETDCDRKDCQGCADCSCDLAGDGEYDRPDDHPGFDTAFLW